MAMIAYDSITILDLVDTATYIYYAKDEKGTGASSAPEAETKYIGFYSGPPFEGTPSVIPGEDWEEKGYWSGWTNYVGKGATVVEVKQAYIKSTDGENRPSEEENWSQSIPSLKDGEYLWIRTTTIYSDDIATETYSVSYFGKDGVDGKDIYIETNQEEVLRFIAKDGTTYSPENLTFKVFKLPRTQESQQLELKVDGEDKPLNFKIEVFGANRSFVEVQNESDFTLYTWGMEITDDEGNSQYVDEDTLYLNLQNLNDYCSEKNNLFYSEKEQMPIRFSYFEEGKDVALKVIVIRTGLTSDMISFEQNAANITASIQQGKLQFDADGLSLYKGVQKTIYIGSQGDALFTGDIYATNGYFSGELQSESGSIGKFEIDQDKLCSTNKDIVLNSNGTIYAKNITIGSGAKIEDYLEFGGEIELDDGETFKTESAYIYNPLTNNKKFIKAGQITLNTDGLLNVGEIEINGGNDTQLSYIKCEPESGARGWRILGDGTAYFKEVTMDKATIQNTIMEVGTVQSVGSLMLFKDSWKVIGQNGNDILIDENHTLSEGDYVLLSNSDEVLKIVAINEDSRGIQFNKTVEIKVEDVITKLGQNKEFLLSILGGKSTEKIKSYASSNSLTLAQFNVSEENIGYTKRLVLGDLTGLGEYVKGIGLYADNVFLNGTLVTEINGNSENDNKSYAGINTLSNVTANKFNDQDETEIVFWAGSLSPEADDIKNAPFQVTKNGSLYASRGIFEGAILTKSTIEGAALYTAEIHGTGTKGNPALKIYDTATNGGIQFLREIEKINEITGKLERISQINLGICNEGLYTGVHNEDVRHFIDLSKGRINYLGNSFQFTDTDFTLYVSESELNLTDKFSISANEIKIKKNATFFEKIVFGEEGTTGRMNYQEARNETTKIGYNLFVS